jgi:hypothetical protein
MAIGSHRSRQPGLWLPKDAPTGAFEIDWSHPITRGLVALYCPSIDPTFDLTGGPKLTVQGTPPLGGGPFGAEWGTSATSSTQPNGLWAASTAAQRPTTAASVYAFVKYTTSPNLASNPPIVGITYDNAGTSPFIAFGLYLDGGAGPFLQWNVGGTFAATTAAAAITTGNYYNFVGTVQTGGSAFCYQNGVQANTAAASAGSINSTTTSQIVLGTNPSTTNAYSSNTSFVISGVWNRALTPAEVALLNDQPFIILRSKASARTYGSFNKGISPTGIASAAAAGVPTITPGSVNISPTGIASNSAPGTPAVSWDQPIAATAVAPATAFGSLTTSVSAVALTGVGIAPTSGVGAPGLVLDGTINPTGIASASGVGAPTQAFGLTPTGIAPASAPGQPAIASPITVGMAGIAPTSGVGTPTVTPIPVSITVNNPGNQFAGDIIAPIGVASTNGFGAPGLSIGPATFTESSEGTTVTTVGPGITDSNGTVWTLTANLNDGNGQRVARNGVKDLNTSQVVELAYHNRLLYQLNSSGNWYVWQNVAWNGPVANPFGVSAPQTLSPAGLGPSPGPGLPGLTSSLQRIFLNNPGTQTQGVQYVVNGNVDGYFNAPTLSLSTDGGVSWVALPADAIVTNSFFNFNRTNNNLGQHDYIIRDANNTAIQSSTVSFNVVAPASAQTAFPAGIAPKSGTGAPGVVAAGVTQNIGAAGIAPTSGVGVNIGQNFPAPQNIGPAAVAPTSRVGVPTAGSNVLSIQTLATVISEFFNAQGAPFAQNLSPSGIPSLFGGPGLPGVVMPAPQTITPTGAAPTSDTGLPGVFGALPLSLLPSGIAPTSGPGAPTIFRALTQGINPTGIASTASVGLETVGSRQPSIIAPFGFSTTLFGFPTVTPAPNQFITARGIAPTFAAGALTTGDGFIKQAPPPDLIHAWRIAARRRAREMAEARDVEETARTELARAKEEILSREYAALQNAIARIEAAQAVVARQQLMSAKAAEATQLMRKLEAARRKAEELQDEKDLEMFV